MSHEKSLTIRVPAELADRIDIFAEARDYTRSDAIRQLLERGLAFGHKIMTGKELERALDKVFREAMKP